MHSGLRLSYLYRAILLAASLYVVPAASAWIKFTPEDLALGTPDWCPAANALVLDMSSAYDVNILSGTIAGAHSLRVKILTDKGKENGNLRIVGFTNYKVNDIEGRTILPDGKTVKVKSNQIFKKTDYAGVDRDTRFTYYDIAFPNVVVGAILELHWQSVGFNVFFIPPHYFDYPGLPVRTSLYTITIPSFARYRVAPLNTDHCNYQYKVEDQISANGNEVCFSAGASKINIDLTKPLSPPDDFVRPHIYMVLTAYDYGFNHYDVVPDWETASKVVAESVKPYAEPTKDVSRLAERLTAGLSKAEIPRVLFRWVSDSIEFVGSRYCWDFDGKLNEKIRDRKGTSAEKVFLLKSLLEASGIASDPFLTVPINDAPLTAGAPALTQFKRIILRVWDGDHAVYLDPTDTNMPFGSLPWNLCEAYALPISAECTGIVRLPNDPRPNTIRSDLSCRISPEGHLSGEGTFYFGQQYWMRYWNRILNADSAAKVELVRKDLLDVIEPDVVRWIETVRDTGTAAGHVRVAFEKKNYASVVGEELLLKPNIISRSRTNFLPEDNARYTNLHFAYPSVSDANCRFELPAGYHISGSGVEFRERPPVAGINYVASMEISPDSSALTYHRRTVRDIRFCESSAYAALRKYYQTIANHDNFEAVLQKSGTGDH